MEIDNYLAAYRDFVTEFGIDMTPPARKEKLVVEVCEFIEAYDAGDSAQADDEALDVMNTAISNVVARGIHNPLFSGYQKLQRTAEKYRRQQCR